MTVWYSAGGPAVLRGGGLEERDGRRRGGGGHQERAVRWSAPSQRQVHLRPVHVQEVPPRQQGAKWETL